MIAKVLVGFAVFVCRILPLKEDIKANKHFLYSLTCEEMSLDK